MAAPTGQTLDQLPQRRMLTIDDIQNQFESA
jgi:hypothetical protein